jgi:uncharacterized protein
MFERAHLQTLSRRIEVPRNHIQVVIGPRQVGKTTLVTQLLARFEGAKLFISADAMAVDNGYLVRPAI